MAWKLNQELQDPCSPEPHILDRVKAFMIFPTNTYYAFHPYSEPKDFALTRSILAKDKTVHRNVAERGSFASNVKSAKGKKKKQPSSTIADSILLTPYNYPVLLVDLCGFLFSPETMSFAFAFENASWRKCKNKNKLFGGIPPGGLKLPGARSDLPEDKFHKHSATWRALAWQ